MDAGLRSGGAVARAALEGADLHQMLGGVAAGEVDVVLEVGVVGHRRIEFIRDGAEQRPGCPVVARDGAVDVAHPAAGLAAQQLADQALADAAAASLRMYCDLPHRSEEHTSELQSLMRISSAVFCLKKKKET